MLKRILEISPKTSYFSILSGGIEDDFSLSERITKTCDNLIESCLKKKTKVTIICCSSFSLNVPPKLDRYGMPISESTVVANYLKNKLLGKIEFELLCEQLSHDTLASLVFLSELYVKNFEITKLNIYCPFYQKRRVLEISKFLKKINFFSGCGLNIVGVDSTVDDKILKDRLRHENNAIEEFKRNTQSIKLKKDFFKFFLRKHTCLNCLFSGRKVSNEFY